MIPIPIIHITTPKPNINLYYPVKSLNSSKRTPPQMTEFKVEAPQKIVAILVISKCYIPWLNIKVCVTTDIGVNKNIMYVNQWLKGFTSLVVENIKPRHLIKVTEYEYQKPANQGYAKTGMESHNSFQKYLLFFFFGLSS